MTAMTSIVNDSTPLRRTLQVDAVASGSMGVLFLVGAGTLEPMLGLPGTLLRDIGILLIPFAGFLVWLAPRAGALRGVVRAVVAANVLWVIASFALLLSGDAAPTTLGTGFIALQAVAVAVFAYMENRWGQSR